MFLKTIFVVCLLFLSQAKSDDEEPPSDDKGLISKEMANFLTTYGYLRMGSENNLESVEDAIKNMQLFGGLEVTGKLNDKTLALLKAPRCGAADLEEKDLRGKRFVVSSGKWDKTDLSYFIASYPTKTEGMTNADVDSAISKAFQRWTAVAPNLKFSVAASEAEATFKIGFTEGLHTDKASFDGVGKVLGHAFYPKSGVIHFDDAETWCKEKPTGENTKFLEFVATHEIGHSLGLKHSTDTGSIMQAYYPGYTPDFVLGQDDIDGIKSLYG